MRAAPHGRVRRGRDTAHRPRGCRNHLAPIVRDLLAAGCEVRGDPLVQEVDARVRAACDADWYREFLDAIIRGARR